MTPLHLTGSPTVKDRVHGSRPSPTLRDRQPRLFAPNWGHRGPLRQPLTLALLGLALFFVPFALLRGHSYITLHDNLDSEINLVYLLHKFQVALDYRTTAVVPSVLNGLPRYALRSGLSPTVWFFRLWSPLPAYVVQQAVVRLLGLLGMYALLRGHWLPGARRHGLAAGLALAWATLPLYTIYGLNVLGQPAVLLAVLHLRAGRSPWWSLPVVAIYSLWSMFVLVGPFVGAAVAALAVFDASRGRWTAAGRMSLAIGVLVAVYVVAEWPLFHSLLMAPYFTSHRVEYDLTQLSSPGLWAGLRQTAAYLVVGQYHTSLFFRGAMVAAMGAALAWAPGGWQQTARQVWPWLAGMVGVAGFCGFIEQLMAMVQQRLPLLHAFNLTRASYLLPLACFGVLAMCLHLLPPGRRREAHALVLAQLLTGLAMNTEWTNNLRELAGRPRPHEPNYSRYVAASLFHTVKTYLAQRTHLQPSGYRVGCLGLPPAVAQLNDFYTLDSYQNNYPLPYKHTFRALIAGELAKDHRLRRYFDAWGNRCYLFSHELGLDYSVAATPVRSVQDWAFDARAFQRLGGRFILSAARLTTPARSGLTPIADFTDSGSYWHIYLYQVVGSSPNTLVTRNPPFKPLPRPGPGMIRWPVLHIRQWSGRGRSRYWE